MGGLRTVAHPGFSKGGGHNRGSGGEPPSHRRLRGSKDYAPSRQRIFAAFTQKTLILAHFFIEKGHVVSAVTVDQGWGTCGPLKF